MTNGNAKAGDTASPVFNILNNTLRALAVGRFKEPTSIQIAAIPKILEGKNVLVIAGTGLGKTESVMLPLFHKIMEEKPKPIALLYVTPLRALNRNMIERLLWWGQKIGIEIAVRHGDTTTNERKLQTEFPPHILITTPEQIQGMLLGSKLRQLLKNIKYIVVDEIHELVQSKRGVQLAVGLERLKYLIGSAPQIIALSATIGEPDLVAQFIFASNDYEIVESKEKKNIEITVDIPKVTVEDKVLAEKLFIGEAVASRVRVINEIISKNRSTLVFTNTREAAEVLSSRIKELHKGTSHAVKLHLTPTGQEVQHAPISEHAPQYKVDVHHSSLSKETRIQTEKEFKEGMLNAIVATSSLELGIDIGLIDFVVQYLSPRQCSKLLQRVGRSGHSKDRISFGKIITTEGDDMFESAVICKNALERVIEPPTFHSCALDVLAHQIIGIVSEYPGIEANKVYEIIKHAYPYKDLTVEQFNYVLDFIVAAGMMFTNKLKRRKRGIETYYAGISTIADTKNYKVIDRFLNAFIGSIDEQFVASHCEPGGTFILKGKAWKVLAIEGDKVIVEHVDAIESAIPAWEGELLPVPEKISLGVNRLQKKIEEEIKRRKICSSTSTAYVDICKQICSEYPVTEYVARKMIEVVSENISKGFRIPDENELVIEKWRNFIILHSYHGSKINETISKYLSTMLSSEFGVALNCKSDPYRIIFDVGTIAPEIFAEKIKNIISDYRDNDIKIILNIALPRTSMFKWHFIQVAKRFGIIGKDAEIDKIGIEKIIRVYSGTPVWHEAYREIEVGKFDIPGANMVLKNSKVEIVNGLSVIASFGLKSQMDELTKPERPEKEILRLFKQRLLKTKLRLICINCGNWAVSITVEDIEPEPRCPRCLSRLIAVTSIYDDGAQGIIKEWLKGKAIGPEKERLINRYRQTAELTIVYGSRAAFVLAARGVGPQAATRILAKPNLTEDEFLKNIIDEERNFVKNRRFWSE